MRISLALVVLLVATGSVADGYDYHDAFRLRESREILPLEDILDRAGLGEDTRVLEIEIEREHGVLVYEIEYVDEQGRIREVYIDARTGAVLGWED